MRGRKTELKIRLTEQERNALQAWQRSTSISAGKAKRGRIILLLSSGIPVSHVAITVGISRRFCYKWTQRFLEYGIHGLNDKEGRGRYRGTKPQLSDTEIV